MQTSDKRLKQLQTAKELLDELEEKTDGRTDNKIRTLRRALQFAGKQIHDEPAFTHDLVDVMQVTAGIAISYDLDNVATRATRLMEKLEDGDDGDEDE